MTLSTAYLSHCSLPVPQSTLLQLLIKELSLVAGTVAVEGKVSYASQEPWVFSGTLRENVLFGLPYRHDWYQKVIEACSLDKDIKQLIDGDLTLVGERGVTLSGGQKARVNLARAVYHDADIVILDDPLSAVDAAVAKHLFEEYINPFIITFIISSHFPLIPDQVHSRSSQRHTGCSGDSSSPICPAS